MPVHVGPTFTPSDSVVGLPLRVVVTFNDLEGAPEQVASAATGPVANVNDAPVGAPTISSNTPTSTCRSPSARAPSLTTTESQRRSVSNGSAATPRSLGRTSTTYVPVDADIGQTLRVVVTYTDLHGTAETVGSAATCRCGPATPPPPPPPPPAPGGSGRVRRFVVAVPVAGHSQHSGGGAGGVGDDGQCDRGWRAG